MTPPRRGDATLEVVPDPAPRAPEAVADAPPEPTLGEYLDVIVRRRWLVAAVAALSILAGVAYAVLATPVYRSDVLLQVEDRNAGLMLGALGDLSAMFGDASPADTEMEILRSRSLVGGVVDVLHLDVQATPRRFPLVGAAIARRHRGATVAPAPLGLGRYAWGGERIQVTRFSIPPDLSRERFVLEAKEGGRFALRGPDGAGALEGKVGEVARSPDGVEVFVAELVARPGTEFRVAAVPRTDAIANLQDDLRVAERGKKTGIMQMTLDGADAGRTAAILDALAQAYVRQNVERKSAAAGKTLEFLESQLPVLQRNLQAAEHAMEGYQSKRGSVDVSLETQAAVARAADIEKASSELQVEYAALRQKFTDAHPALAAMKQKLDRLAAERAVLDTQFRRLPAHELESARLLRDLKVANELYLTVLNRAQELKVVKEGTVGNVRVLDAAVVPLTPISPRRGAVVLLSVLLGLAAGLAAAFALHALDPGVEDPAAVERAAGVGVHASIPYSAVQSTNLRRSEREGGRPPLLAEVDPKDLAIEALRSLRTSLEFELLDAPNNIVTVGGPAPSVGKSFVTVNLAHVLGETGKRVVIVDADLRRGHLHRMYGVDRAQGLTEVVTGHLPLADALRPTSLPSVRVLTTGTLPPNPAELLGSERFERVLAELSRTFDVVLVDTPPVLAVTDGLVVARRAGVNLFVIWSGKHPAGEITAAVRQMARSRIRLHGIVMNGVALERGLGRRSAYHYQYHYR
ncbi:polysaccharide biosynthesis tyrosine autokinase [Anaeromyxobacter oryzae]|uniref:Tyrosine kinase BceF n=1 Tax=Anaeromyxobacter oryzae TaxID=2918170 RepID=A0ABM7WVF1_9BACT|nr:polysaccharide biosynthesis tyrosine autokinase [Anaeromyxobacter oryzae]BDG03427.1 tyrosine kinase BceF [Anaeromyxobacter oryzae]